MELIKLFVRSAFLENIIFAYLLGMCSYFAISRQIKSSIGLGVAVIFVLAVTLPVNYLLLKYVLNPGAMAWLSKDLANVDISYFSFITFIATIAAMTQLVEMIIERFSPTLYGALGIFLPLIAVNCAILAGSLFMTQKQFQSVIEAIVYAVGLGFGWFLAITIFACVRERLKYSNPVPQLRGLGLAFITTGILGICFLAFSGI